MAHKLTFFPIGNADTTLIELDNNQKILFDYAHMRDSNDKDDKRIDLPVELNKSVTGDYDVVCFTHADRDHINRFSEYFYLDHAKIYQDDKRKKIKELWIPAAVILEKNLEGDACILRQEARHRLKNKRGIRVFSRPKAMKDWCNEQDDICYDDVCHLFVDAGTLAPGFDKEQNGVEFFVHSPFISETQNINRNASAITIQATFNDACESKMILGSDITYEVWEDIVKITKYKMNEDKLVWDIFHTSHHCSYTAISPDKGIDQTEPTENVKWLFETQGNKNCRIISPSWQIPSEDTLPPPHRKAANYYKSVISAKDGEFIVTMEHPNLKSPQPIVFEIDKYTCATLKKVLHTGAYFAGTKTPPRAG